MTCEFDEYRLGRRLKRPRKKPKTSCMSSRGIKSRYASRSNVVERKISKKECSAREIKT